MRRVAIPLTLMLMAVLAVGVWMTRATPMPADTYAGLDADPANGEAVFWLAGCASCHAVKGSEGDDRLILAGGQAFASDFGTFYAPNISMDPVQGIGDWTLAQFGTAMQRGVSPEGQHYYPAFPYTAYALVAAQDVTDLWAFWQTLPTSDSESRPHDLDPPFSIRRAVGAWKLLYADKPFQMDVEGAELLRGRYLVEALAHCAECHTPRDVLGGLDRARWMAGAPNPSGGGRIPAITPTELSWSEDEVAAYLKDGFTPEFDSAGGHMVSVVRNLARASDADRAAIAAYVKALPGGSGG